MTTELFVWYANQNQIFSEKVNPRPGLFETAVMAESQFIVYTHLAATSLPGICSHFSYILPLSQDNCFNRPKCT